MSQDISTDPFVKPATPWYRREPTAGNAHSMVTVSIAAAVSTTVDMITVPANKRLYIADGGWRVDNTSAVTTGYIIRFERADTSAALPLISVMENYNTTATPVTTLTIDQCSPNTTLSLASGASASRRYSPNPPVGAFDNTTGAAVVVRLYFQEGGAASNSTIYAFMHGYLEDVT